MLSIKVAELDSIKLSLFLRYCLAIYCNREFISYCTLVRILSCSLCIYDLACVCVWFCKDHVGSHSPCTLYLPVTALWEALQVSCLQNKLLQKQLLSNCNHYELWTLRRVVHGFCVCLNVSLSGCVTMLRLNAGTCTELYWKQNSTGLAAQSLKESRSRPRIKSTAVLVR